MSQPQRHVAGARPGAPGSPGKQPVSRSVEFVGGLAPRRNAGTGIDLEISGQVESRVKAGNLVGVAVEHQSCLLGRKQAGTDQPLFRLAPARMIYFGINIGIKTVFRWRRI